MKHYVYHIARPGMDLSEGYIGVTNNPARRWREHIKGGCNKHLDNALNKYSDAIMSVITICTKEYALELETKLRPAENIGWNIAKGGGMPSMDEPWNKGRTDLPRGHKCPAVTKMLVERNKSIKYVGLDNGMADHTVYSFWHRDNGVVNGTQTGMASELNLNRSHVSAVVNGTRLNTKGFILLKNKDLVRFTKKGYCKWV